MHISTPQIDDPSCQAIIDDFLESLVHEGTQTARQEAAARLTGGEAVIDEAMRAIADWTNAQVAYLTGEAKREIAQLKILRQQLTTPTDSGPEDSRLADAAWVMTSFERPDVAAKIEAIRGLVGATPASEVAS